MTIPAAPASRYHALDALRAAMMFLGIYLHAAVVRPTVIGAVLNGRKYPGALAPVAV